MRRLLCALTEPTATVRLSSGEWSALIADARRTNLLGLLAQRLSDAGVDAPPEPRRHLDACRQLSERQSRAVRWDVHCVQRALEPLAVPVVLLKGAAYALSGSPVARGRLFGDIDVLVPHEALGEVELRLMVGGWASAKSTAYDQRYYRRWMHELPPMVHVRRGSVLDVHHTILPLTSRRRPDPSRIIRDSTPLAGLPGVRIPRPEHLLIHSIVHLLHDGEMHNALRDLFDIDALVRQGARREDFWQRLIGEAVELDVAAPVQFGLYLTRRVIGTPVPRTALAGLGGEAGRAAGPSVLLASLYHRALWPRSGVSSAVPALASLAIYLRAHWLRMPPRLLLRHLAHKALLRLKKDEPALAGRA